MLLHRSKELGMPFQVDLTLLKTKDHLISFLELDEKLFDDVLAFDPKTKTTSDHSSDNLYYLALPVFFQHEIPKKTPKRGHRIVWEPVFLKSNYKALARRLNSFLTHKLDGFPHARTFGYVGGRNIRENARDHCGNKHLLSIDLKDFFPSIKALRVAAFLEETGMEQIVADLLSSFITIEGSLPLGLPTSPTIANAICLPMDIELETLAQRHGAVFSRYADDISFSSSGAVPRQSEIAACIERHGFEIAESKTRTSILGQAHYVTGLSVTDPTQPHIPRKKKRRLRQELYYAKKYGLDEHLRRIRIHDHYVQQYVNRLDGLVKFTAYHEPRLSADLKTTWAKVLQASGHHPSFKPKNQHQIPFSIFVDEAEYVRPDGHRVLALAMAASQHQDQINEVTRGVLNAALSDIWAAGDRNSITKKGVHFSDATEDMRLTYIERMRSLPFEGYVAMAMLPDANAYETTYLRLLKAMIKRRLMASESRYAFFRFEQNSKVRQETVRKVVHDAYVSLQKTNNRHPEHCGVEFVEKPNLGLSVPDFLLGVLGKYLANGPDQEDRPTQRNKLLFERIRDKYRLILNVDDRVEYSRRRPIQPW
jgi:RNA-directed DNA polymerase